MRPLNLDESNEGIDLFFRTLLNLLAMWEEVALNPSWNHFIPARKEHVCVRMLQRLLLSKSTVVWRLSGKPSSTSEDSRPEIRQLS